MAAQTFELCGDEGAAAAELEIAHLCDTVRYVMENAGQSEHARMLRNAVDATHAMAAGGVPAHVWTMHALTVLAAAERVEAYERLSAEFRADGLAPVVPLHPGDPA